MKKCGCKVTAALHEEISQAGRHSIWRRQQKLAERQCWVVPWWCSEQWIPNPLSGMEVPDEKRLGKSNDEINEDRTRKGSEKNFSSH